MGADVLLGYAALIARFSLPDLGLEHASYLRAAGGMHEEQRADGSWEDVRYATNGRIIYGRYGASYATATNCLVLLLPESQLPIFAR